MNRWNFDKYDRFEIPNFDKYDKFEIPFFDNFGVHEVPTFDKLSSEEDPVKPSIKEIKLNLYNLKSLLIIKSINPKRISLESIFTDFPFDMTNWVFV